VYLSHAEILSIRRSRDERQTVDWNVTVDIHRCRAARADGKREDHEGHEGHEEERHAAPPPLTALRAFPSIVEGPLRGVSYKITQEKERMRDE
jgi:hypothetical protein